MLSAEYLFPVSLSILTTASTSPFNHPHTCGPRMSGQNIIQVAIETGVAKDDDFPCFMTTVL